MDGFGDDGLSDHSVVVGVGGGRGRCVDLVRDGDDVEVQTAVCNLDGDTKV